MSNSKRNNFTTKVTVGLLVMGAITAAIPAFADEVRITNKTTASENPPETATGSAEDLKGIASSEWSWGVGEEKPAYGTDTRADRPFNPLAIQEQQEEWQNTNRGDSETDSPELTITDF